MNKEVISKIDTLINTIKSSNEYKEYIELLDKVSSSNEIKELKIGIKSFCGIRRGNK